MLTHAQPSPADRTQGHRRRLARYCRLTVFLFVLAALAPVPGANWTAVLPPALSPHLGLIAAISLRSFARITLLAIPVLLVSLFKVRAFCRFACPAGFILDAAGSLGTRTGLARGSRGIRIRVNRWILWLTLGGSLAGVPMLLLLDPLSLFNGFAGFFFRGPRSWRQVLPASGFVLLVCLSIFRPGLWCFGICPLGAMQRMLYDFRRRVLQRRNDGKGKHDDSTPMLSRRTALSLLAGTGFGLLLKPLLARRAVLRPPGSVSEDQFNALCVRCGNCIRICPEQILIPAGRDAGPGGVFTPVVRMQPGYCSEFCNRCNTVCPTGAIAMLSLERKNQISIGTAVVHQKDCLAWEHGEYCMVCDEFCPYHAIEIVEHQGVNCPKVKPEECRGCGLCQKECPATTTAIIVEPRPQQRVLRD